MTPNSSLVITFAAVRLISVRSRNQYLFYFHQVYRKYESYSVQGGKPSLRHTCEARGRKAKEFTSSPSCALACEGPLHTKYTRFLTQCIYCPKGALASEKSVDFFLKYFLFSFLFFSIDNGAQLQRRWAILPEILTGVSRIHFVHLCLLSLIHSCPANISPTNAAPNFIRSTPVL